MGFDNIQAGINSRFRTIFHGVGRFRKVRCSIRGRHFHLRGRHFRRRVYHVDRFKDRVLWCRHFRPRARVRCRYCRFRHGFPPGV